jgi:alkylation response protein AidB-like acyl-CoA dehydrogenase
MSAMELTFGEEYESYRTEIRSFLFDRWPAGWRGGSREDQIAFRKLATEHGYLNRSFTRQFGGSEQPSDPAKAQIISEEFGRAHAPQEAGIGVAMFAPTLLERGEQWQKEKFIAPTLSGEIRWCQGYSEPGAGSDLASLRTAAILDGDEWIINGQKIWTTEGHVADFMFILVRTERDVPGKQGISYLLLDMHQPGVDVRPLRQITGSAEFNEVFLTEARTPLNWMVGQRGEGWSVANTTLKHERGGVGGTARIDAQFASLVKLVQRTSIDGHAAIADPGIRERLVQIQSRVEAHRYCSYFQLSRSLKGEDSGRVSFMNKLNATNLGQRMADLALDVLQDNSLLDPMGGTEGARPGDERWMNQYLGSLALAIAGGTSNIQRNIIAERGLGLPRDAQAARTS